MKAACGNVKSLGETPNIPKAASWRPAIFSPRLFRPNGEIRSGLIDESADQIPIEKLIFEAPQKEQQVWFIKKFGSNVNLGNIRPAEVIPLETLRLGLRGDTLFDFYSIDDDVNQLYAEDGKADTHQEK